MQNRDALEKTILIGWICEWIDWSWAIVFVLELIVVRELKEGRDLCRDGRFLSIFPFPEDLGRTKDVEVNLASIFDIRMVLEVRETGCSETKQNNFAFDLLQLSNGKSSTRESGGR